MSEMAVIAEPHAAARVRGRSPGRVMVRAMVSVVALAAVASRVSPGEISASFAGLDWRWMIAAVAAVYVSILASVFKWGLLLRSRGHSLPSARLARHYLVGLFFNSFLPTSMGGDVVRTWDAGADLGDSSEAAASVIAERLIAAVGLALTAAIGLPFVHLEPQVYFSVAAVFVAGIGLAALFLLPSVSGRIVRGFSVGRFENVAGWVARTAGITGSLLRNPRPAGIVLVLSVAFQVTVAAVNWTLFRALGVELSFAHAIICTSIISAVTMVPVTISGHGVREAGYAYFFAFAGVSSAVSVTASVLFFATVAACTLPGALLFAAGRRRRA